MFCCIAIFSSADDVLESVQIVEGISQTRPKANRQTIGRRYVWNFKGKPYTVLITISIERYNTYTSKNHDDIPKLVEEGTKSLENLTREFQRMVQVQQIWSKSDQVDYVLSFVQSLPYTHDDVTTGYDEFRRYAAETLIEGGGDCEDTTVLAASLLCGLGEFVALIFSPGHIAIGVSGDFSGSFVEYNGIKYYYCETTGAGWKIGQLPIPLSQGVKVLPLNRASLSPNSPEIILPEPIIPTPPASVPTPEIETVSPPTPTVSPAKAPDVSASQVGKVIALVFILVGFGCPIFYVLYRFLVVDDNDDGWTDDEDNTSTESSTEDLLDL